MHFANGREAKIGDHVAGTVYNTRRDPTDDRSPLKMIAGVLVKAVPGCDTCNAEVEFIESTEIPPSAETPLYSVRPRTAVGEPILAVSGDGKPRASWRCRDYTHVGALLHAEDAFAAADELAGRTGRVVDLGAAARALGVAP